MLRVAVPVVLVVLLTALALISCLSVEDKREIRGAPRPVWVLVILLLPLLGAIAWFLFGRPRKPGAPVVGWPGGGPPEPPRGRAPDDDPEFLRSLDQRTLNGDDEEQHLRQWEEDLRRREEDRRHRDPGGDG